MHIPFFDIRKLRARFRRWSRTNYAMFASLGREVLIGHLSTDVADASLRKLKKRLLLTPPYMLRADRCTAMPDDPPPDGSGTLSETTVFQTLRIHRTCRNAATQPADMPALWACHYIKSSVRRHNGQAPLRYSGFAPQIIQSGNGENGAEERSDACLFLCSSSIFNPLLTS